MTTVEQYISNQCNIALSCDLHKVEFRNALTSACDKLASDYVEQYKKDLISWSELGHQLERLQEERLKILRGINNL